MTAGEADVLKIVVLASGTNTLLTGGGARVVTVLCAQENILELVHAGVGKQQGRVVGGHQRRRVHTTVPLACRRGLLTLKKPQKIFPNLAAGTLAHKRSVYQPAAPNLVKALRSKLSSSSPTSFQTSIQPAASKSFSLQPPVVTPTVQTSALPAASAS